jgi:hypothetical protein
MKQYLKKKDKKKEDMEARLLTDISHKGQQGEVFLVLVLKRHHKQKTVPFVNTRL